MIIILAIISGLTYTILKNEEPEIVEKAPINVVKVAPKSELKIECKLVEEIK